MYLLRTKCPSTFKALACPSPLSPTLHHDKHVLCTPSAPQVCAAVDAGVVKGPDVLTPCTQLPYRNALPAHRSSHLQHLGHASLHSQRQQQTFLGMASPPVVQFTSHCRRNCLSCTRPQLAPRGQLCSLLPSRLQAFRLVELQCQVLSSTIIAMRTHGGLVCDQSRSITTVSATRNVVRKINVALTPIFPQPHRTTKINIGCLRKASPRAWYLSTAAPSMPHRARRPRS